MDRSDLQAWLDRYVEAWRSNDADQIAALFTADATYRWHPYDAADQTVRGRDAIVAAWLEHADDPDSWEASYEAYACDGERAVATGTSRYAATGSDPERLYYNVFLLEFAADGRCSAFTEYFMQQPSAG